MKKVIDLHILQSAKLYYDELYTGFAKTFYPSLVILSDEAGVLRQTFFVLVSHSTLKMACKYYFFAGHFV